ncbi:MULTISPECIES: hypothetical protein [Stenotrophomonas]|uniref:hypothetical protein n=1 Tax=Stenotrophomonas TaxID=40323 RepID=UPI0021C9F596|nr:MULTISPECIES: hypothetical protein [Stenotrophomonas]MCU1137050.1 hypothetical protein [Stenotrophomonas maltophilia]
MNSCPDTASHGPLLSQAQFEELSRKVQAALEGAGWVEGRGALAAKVFKTVQGDRAAVVYLYRDDGFNHSLAFNFTSEGRNVCSAAGVLIPVGADDNTIAALVGNAVEAAEHAVASSFAVRALSF